jgi:hypothetical protein
VYLGACLELVLIGRPRFLTRTGLEDGHVAEARDHPYLMLVTTETFACMECCQ